MTNSIKKICVTPTAVASGDGYQIKNTSPTTSKAIRNEIKTLSAKQTELKKLRKPSNIKEDTLDKLGLKPSQWYKPQEQISNYVNENKDELRHLFQAYAILKHKERPKVIKSYINERKVKDLVEKFKVLLYKSLIRGR